MGFLVFILVMFTITAVGAPVVIRKTARSVSFGSRPSEAKSWARLEPVVAIHDGRRFNSPYQLVVADGLLGVSLRDNGPTPPLTRFFYPEWWFQPPELTALSTREEVAKGVSPDRFKLAPEYRKSLEAHLLEVFPSDRAALTNQLVDAGCRES